MELRYKYVLFLLGVNLFSAVSVRATNVSEVLEEQIRNETQVIGIFTEKSTPFGFENKSFYDQKECDCGWGSTGCSLVDGQKVCKCDWQYEQNNDKCERCYCGIFSSKCYFKYGKKMCSCFGDYKQNNLGECAECNCGYNSVSCEFSSYSKVCTCQPGYLVISGKCESCDCGPMSTSCDLTFDKYTRCTCLPGYVAERSGWETDERCKLPGPSGWKIAIYIESVFFGSFILICVIMIFCNRKSS